MAATVLHRGELHLSKEEGIDRRNTHRRWGRRMAVAAAKRELQNSAAPVEATCNGADVRHHGDHREDPEQRTEEESSRSTAFTASFKLGNGGRMIAGDWVR